MKAVNMYIRLKNLWHHWGRMYDPNPNDRSQSESDRDILIVYHYWLKVRSVPIQGRIYKRCWRIEKERASEFGYAEAVRWFLNYQPRLDLSGPYLERESDKAESLIYRMCEDYSQQSVVTSLPLPTPPPPPVETNFNVVIHNTKSENYLIYWVMGNYLIEDLDRIENEVRFMGIIHKGGQFSVKTIVGHRFYIIPHRLNSPPNHHPRTDKEFIVEPYYMINIHDKSEDKLFIDEKGSLSQMNKWKFNALKLDYLLREVIKLGGKNNDVLASILDLHEDIKLDGVSEGEKDMAGIPSALTNIT